MAATTWTYSNVTVSWMAQHDRQTDRQTDNKTERQSGSQQGQLDDSVLCSSIGGCLASS